MAAIKQSVDVPGGIPGGKKLLKWGYIDANGKAVTPPKYDKAKRFAEGMGAVGVGASRSVSDFVGLWGFVDKTGAEIVPLMYNEVAPFFSEGLAAVKLADKWGFIDKQGVVVIPLEYESRWDSHVTPRFQKGLAEVVRDGRVILIDKAGREIAQVDTIAAKK